MAGIAGDLAVEDDEAGGQFCNMGADGIAMPLQQGATLDFGAGAFFPQRCVAQHLADRHSGRLEPAQELDPGQDRGVVVTLAGTIAVGVGQQPDPLIVANRVGRQSATLRQLTDLHAHLSLVTTRGKLRVRAHSKSSAIRPHESGHSERGKLMDGFGARHAKAHRPRQAADGLRTECGCPPRRVNAAAPVSHGQADPSPGTTWAKDHCASIAKMQ